MKKACPYCKGIHERSWKCTAKPRILYQKKRTREDIFRSSYAWQQKRTRILKRDKYLCRACLNNLYGTVCRLTSANLSVHHIKPLKLDFDSRLDDDNLITLCGMHHELAESGIISADELVQAIPHTLTTSFSETAPT
ncbi:MAG: HNH endonuclease [Ruminococcus flavefaciens]|nr:HNH endonuclease [Ruminococcus flavefaciens]